LPRRAFNKGLLTFAAAPSCVGTSPAEVLDPRMRMIVPAGAPRTVALTLDACGGDTDMRVIEALLAYAVPATIFIAGPWLHRNASTLALLRARSDLFRLENHGERHVPPILGTHRIYHLPVAGTLEEVRHEVEGGSALLVAAGVPKPQWYRGAAALYSEAALQSVEAMGWKVGAWSLNADQGASLPAAHVTARIEQAVSGDVIIGHVNQPHHPSGGGIAAGIARLHQAGAVFVRLGDLPTTPLTCHRTGHQDLVA